MKCSNNKFYAIALYVVTISTNVMAEQDASVITASSDPMSGQYLIQLILGLLVVLVSIVVLAWLAKRVNRLQSSSGSILKILGGVSMGSRERIVLLQVGDSQLLIGVAPGRINTLHVLDEPIVDTEGKYKKVTPENITESFSEKLKGIISESAK